MFFPLVLSSVSDALVALGRIGTFLTADELEDPYLIDESSDNKWALSVDGSFTWETVGKPVDSKFAHGGPGGGHGMGRKGAGGGEKEKREKKGKKGKKNDTILPTTAPSADAKSEAENKEEKPFALDSLSLRIPKGAFIAIVGRVGSGKSSFLQALVGEMRKTKGEVVFGGSVAYVPQQPWIVNATLKDNVLFGKEEDEERCGYAVPIYRWFLADCYDISLALKKLFMLAHCSTILTCFRMASRRKSERRE